MPDHPNRESPDFRLLNPPEVLFTVHYYATINHVNEKLMPNIMWCESKNHANARKTKAVAGIDLGPGQINSYYHEKEMKRPGMDIHDTEDNIEYMAQLL